MDTGGLASKATRYAALTLTAWSQFTSGQPSDFLVTNESRPPLRHNNYVSTSGGVSQVSIVGISSQYADIGTT